MEVQIPGRGAAGSERCGVHPRLMDPDNVMELGECLISLAYDRRYVRGITNGLSNWSDPAFSVRHRYINWRIVWQFRGSFGPDLVLLPNPSCRGVTSRRLSQRGVMF